MKVTRNGPHGTLQLNTGQVISGASTGALQELNLNLPLYLGGYRFAYSLNEDSGIVIGLDGAIQRLIVNGNAIEDLVDVAKDSRGISKYIGNPCDDRPLGKNRKHHAKKPSKPKCLNGGICTPFFRSFACKCGPDYIGQRCENRKSQHSCHSLVTHHFFHFQM